MKNKNQAYHLKWIPDKNLTIFKSFIKKIPPSLPSNPFFSFFLISCSTPFLVQSDFQEFSTPRAYIDSPHLPCSVSFPICNNFSHPHKPFCFPLCSSLSFFFSLFLLLSSGSSLLSRFFHLLVTLILGIIHLFILCSLSNSHDFLLLLT